MRRMAAALLALTGLVSACSSGSGTGSSATSGAAGAATTARAAATAAAAPAGAATTPPAGATTAPARATTLDQARQVVRTGNRLTEAQAGCVVERLVTAVGEARALTIVNDGNDLSALPAEDARTATAALLACVPAAELGKVISTTFYEALKDVGVTQTQATCFGDKLTATLTPEAMVALGSGATAIERLDPATQGKVLAALAACLPPDLLGQLGAALGPTGASPTTAGR